MGIPVVALREYSSSGGFLFEAGLPHVAFEPVRLQGQGEVIALRQVDALRGQQQFEARTDVGVCV